MNLINNNPYRVLGLPITAKEKEIARQINSLATSAWTGKKISLDTDFPFLSTVNRTPDLIEEAKKQIEQDDGKLFNSLFWFWKNNSADELALEVLQEGNTNKAISIWEKSVFANKHKVHKPVILIENLISHSKSWSEQDDDDHCLKRNEDEYIIERKIEKNYSIPSVFAEFDNENNWMIDCDTKWLSGIDNNSYGIVFGREKGSYFSFQISASGHFRFDKYIEWSFNEIIPWEKSSYIKEWGANNLKIKKISNQFNFYINDNLVGTHESKPFFGNFFGFKVSSNQKIFFRNFKFCKLVEDETYGEGINVSSKNFSSIKNLSTLYLSLATNNGTLQLDNFKKGIALARSFFSTENIEEYSKLITNEQRYKYNSEKALHFYISDVIDSLKSYLEKPGGITTNQLINAFSSFPVEANQFLNNRFVVKQIQNIDKEIEIAKTERKKSAATATEAGKTLVNNTKADLDYLRKILGTDDVQYQNIADKLSLAIVQCGIDAFNFCKTPNGEIDYPNAIRSEEGYIHEYEYAFSVAFTQRARDRAKENLDSCNQYIENKHYYYCWFCGNNSPDKHSSFYKTMYKENSRTGFLVGHRSVQYSYNDFEIPRCESCEKIHSSGTDTYVYIKVSGGILGVVVGLIIDSSSGGGFFLGLVLGVFVGWLTAEALKNQKLSKSNIKGTDQSTIQNHPLINRLVKEGWQFSKPTA